MAEGDSRDRGAVEGAVVEALLDRGEEGMTVLELRAAVDADIESIETALSRLKAEGRIDVSMDGGETVIRPDGDAGAGGAGDRGAPSLLDRLRERLPF